jgi:hypothetical protein
MYFVVLAEGVDMFTLSAAATEVKTLSLENQRFGKKALIGQISGD